MLRANATGYGGGAGAAKQNQAPFDGSDGRVFLRCPNATTISVAPGSNSVATDGSDNVATFNVTGTISF